MIAVQDVASPGVKPFVFLASCDGLYSILLPLALLMNHLGRQKFKNLAEWTSVCPACFDF